MRMHIHDLNHSADSQLRSRMQQVQTFLGIRPPSPQASPPFNLVVAERGAKVYQSWEAGGSGQWPTAGDLVRWLVDVAAPPLVALTPKSLDDRLLDGIRAQNKSLLVAAGA